MGAAALPTVGLSFAAELFLDPRGIGNTDLSFLRGFLLLLLCRTPALPWHLCKHRCELTRCLKLALSSNCTCKALC